MMERKITLDSGYSATQELVVQAAAWPRGWLPEYICEARSRWDQNTRVLKSTSVFHKHIC